MIVLDTNVISELMRREPHPGVLGWLDARPASSIWTTAVSVFEVRFGLRTLPKGKRRNTLEVLFERALEEVFEHRVLDFDLPAANTAAEIAAAARAAGEAMEIRDVQIAGIVEKRKAILATRNSAHFHQIRAQVVNPWEV